MIVCGITGHTGVLGSNFVKKNPNIKFIRFKDDLSKKKHIKIFISKNSFDCFCHFGAVVPTNKVKSNFEYAKKVNHESTIHIVKELKKKKKNIWFFFSSSSHVYGYSDKKLKETDKTKPINEYGKLKVLSENFLKKNVKNSNVKLCIGRIFSFTHKNQNKSFFVPAVLSGNSRPVNTYRDFIDIRDICDVIKLLMVEKKTGVFNIASGKKINLLKIFELITKKKIKKNSESKK